MRFDTSQKPYERLRHIVGERTTPLIAWVGSGLSAEAGLPGWTTLRDLLLDAFRAKAMTLDARDAEHALSKADRIQANGDLWVAFEQLKDALGPMSYREAVREALSPADSAVVPSVYTALWQLGIKGLLNLNIDRLATRALSQLRPGVNSAEFSGQHLGGLPRLLTGHQPFIANLHGIAEDGATWVFTTSELKALMRSRAYNSVISTCLSANTVLFVGVSTDDMAVGGHLQRLVASGIETASHFWLTDRRDYETDRWAERAGVQVIRYDAPDGDHSAVDDFFADLAAYVPAELDDDEPSIASVDLVPDVRTSLSPPEVLLKEEAETVRRVLNEYARGLLNHSTRSEEEIAEAYDEFSDEYDEVIHHAWYTSTKEGRNKLFGYTLESEVAKGTFGRVFRATDPLGKRVAVKVLLEEIRNDRRLRHSFRRGVRSMQILREHNINGMVSYLEASEIPAFVVMDWIDGPNLETAKQSRFLDDWAPVLRIGVDLAKIIRAGHFLPERVLHRDIRPSNVMLKDYFEYPNGGWEVVVLDFDLSWHRGAYEQTAMLQTAVGYLAPEQTRPIPGISTRNAAVDSFGLGMTLLYLCDGLGPVPNQHLQASWDEHVVAACARLPAPAWRSLPARYARLITASTRDAQAERWDMTEILGELERLQVAEANPNGVDLAELLTEELAARCSMMAGYIWNPDTLAALHVLPTGLSISLTAGVREQAVMLSVEYSSTGVEARGGFAKYISRGAKSAAEKLQAGGWSKVHSHASAKSVELVAQVDAGSLRGFLSDYASSIDDALGQMRFSDAR